MITAYNLCPVCYFLSNQNIMLLKIINLFYKENSTNNSSHHILQDFRLENVLSCHLIQAA